MSTSFIISCVRDANGSNVMMEIIALQSKRRAVSSARPQKPLFRFLLQLMKYQCRTKLLISNFKKALRTQKIPSLGEQDRDSHVPVSLRETVACPFFRAIGKSHHHFDATCIDLCAFCMHIDHLAVVDISEVGHDERRERIEHDTLRRSRFHARRSGDGLAS